MKLERLHISYERRLEGIARHLEAGDRKDAAYTAVRLAEAQTNVELLRQTVRVLADALVAIGDAHTGRGRPSKPKPLVERAADGAIVAHLPEIAEHPDKQKARVRQTLLEMAADTYQWLLIARDVYDGRHVSPFNLAGLMWVFDGSVAEGCEGGSAREMQDKTARAMESDEAGALALVRPVAERELKRYGLIKVPRQGFKAHALRKVADHYRFTVDQLKRAQ
jgi:hypothetical protein